MRGTILLLAAVAVGCAPTAQLRVRPDSVCAGRSVQLTWEGSHSGELSADPADPSLGVVPESGQRKVRPKTTTTYRFRVSSLLAVASAEQTVKVLAPPATPAVIRGAPAEEGSGCAPGRMWVTARVEPGAWDTRLRVDEIASADGRSYRVEHAAVQAEVTPDASTGALRDLPITGAWKLETPLRPGERCGEASAPESLSVSVTFLCAD
ncbi:MAG TPA: hypothetical protein VMR50_16025 [Myxococcota bacterium]|nr:hypothetical protein [Myxococcota bacterium]